LATFAITTLKMIFVVVISGEVWIKWENPVEPRYDWERSLTL
jgi:hypothetical protein